MTNRLARWLPAVLVAVAGAGQAADAEEARVDGAAAALPELHLQAAGTLLTAAVADAADAAAAVAAARAVGRALWQAERAAVQAGAADDRGLYWRRLAAKRAYRAGCAAPAPCDAVLEAFEQTSRGIGEVGFASRARLRIALSGFDPFNLDARVDQSNPSGLVALRLDGVVLSGHGRRAEVQTVMLPVRFADFDDGLVETVFEPLIADGLFMLVTVSMGRDQFDLERFPGRRRSATAPDSRGVVTGASSSNPLIPRLGASLLPGPEFVEFSLPVTAMQAESSPYAVRDNRTVETLERGRFEAASLAELAGQTAVSGSGGGYLSNEVSFRTVRLVRAAGADVAVGHIHTPRVQGYAASTEADMADQVRRMIESALPRAPASPTGLDVSSLAASRSGAAP